MPRLFTGISLPASQTTMLQLSQSGLKNARWIEPSDMHITLRFIGDVENRIANDIVEALDQRSWLQPEISLGELRAFGSSKPKSVYVSVAENEPLTRLQLAQERLMQQIGLPAIERKFTPHVTLARLKSEHTDDKVARYLASQGGLIIPPFKPKQFHLYSAKASTGGGPYRIEESFPLDP